MPKKFNPFLIGNLDEVSDLSGYQPLDAELTALAGLDATAGLVKQTGAGAFTKITDNSSNWNTAYGWGNHASAGYALSANVVPLSYLDTDGTLAANSDSKVASQKAVKSYVDATANNIKWKASVRAASTANGTLASAFQNGSVIDGVTLATGDRILLKNQTTGSENGIYVVAASGAPARAADADASAEIRQMNVSVEEGTTNADTQWTCSNDGTITLGSTALTFVKIGPGGGASVAGADTQVQFNDGGAMGASSDLTFNKTSKALNVPVHGFTAQSSLPASPTAGMMVLYSVTGRTVLMQYSGSAWTPVTSYGAMTLYVDTVSGTDSVTKGTGTGANAFKTINYALSQVPPIFGGNVTINVAAGTYDELVAVQGKKPTGPYAIYIVGTLGTTGGLGTTTISTGYAGWTNAQATVTVSGTPWSTNAYRNLLIHFLTGPAAGEYRVIDSNTSNTLTLCGPYFSSNPSSGTFEILNWQAVIQPTGYNSNARAIYQLDSAVYWQNMKMVCQQAVAPDIVQSFASFDKCYMGGHGTKFSVLEYHTSALRSPSANGAPQYGRTADWFGVNNVLVEGTRISAVSGADIACLARIGYVLIQRGTVIDAEGANFGIYLANNAHIQMFPGSPPMNPQYVFIKNAANTGLYVVAGSGVLAASLYAVYSGNTANSYAEAASYSWIS